MWRHEDPHRVKVFDYRYFIDTRDGTKRSATFTCATAVCNAAWPGLWITPAPGKLGFIEYFDDHPVFDMLDPAFAENFTTRTADDRFATAVLDARMRRFLLERGRAFDIAFFGAWLLIAAENVPPELAPKMALFLDDVLAHVPRVVNHLFEPPLDGDLSTPMPDPYATPAQGGEASQRDLDVAGTTSSIDSMLDLHDRVMTRSRSPNSPGMPGAATDIAGRALNLDIMSVTDWSDTKGRFDGLDEPGSDDRPRYDLDGNLIEPVEQDPWGDGRELPGSDDDERPTRR